MAQIKTGDIHGLYRIFVGLVDENGYNVGQVGDGITEGTLATPFEMKYAQDAPITLPERTVIDFTGGDVWTGSYQYGITALGGFTITSSTVDADLVAFLTDSTVDQTTNTLQTIMAENVLLPSVPQGWLLIVSRIQAKESGRLGANKYLSIAIPRAWINPQGPSGAPSFQTQGTYNYQVTPTVSDRAPWGMDFSNLNLQDGITPNLYVITDYPPHLVTYIASSGSSSETFTLPFKVNETGVDYTTPSSSDQRLQVYVDGDQVDATSVDPATGSIEVAAPNTSFAGGERITVFYETQNYALTS